MKTHPWKNWLTGLAVFGLTALGTLLGPMRPAQAALQQHVVADDRAGSVPIGNSAELDCRDSSAKKRVDNTFTAPTASGSFKSGGTFLKVSGAAGAAEAGAGLLLFALMALSGGRRPELA